MFALITTRSTPRFPSSGRLLSLHAKLDAATAYRRSLQQAERSVTGAIRESCTLRIVVLQRTAMIGEQIGLESSAASLARECAMRTSRKAAAHSRTRRGPRYTMPV
jgi:hypothetical protein